MIVNQFFCIDLVFFCNAYTTVLNDCKKKPIGYGRENCEQMVIEQDLFRQDHEMQFMSVLDQILDYAKRE